MKKTHRRAGWLVAGVACLSLGMLPRESGAAMIKWFEPPQVGDPDQPNGSPLMIKRFTFQVQGGTLLIIPTPEFKRPTVATTKSRTSKGTSGR